MQPLLGWLTLADPRESLSRIQRALFQKVVHAALDLLQKAQNDFPQISVLRFSENTSYSLLKWADLVILEYVDFECVLNLLFGQF